MFKIKLSILILIFCIFILGCTEKSTQNNTINNVNKTIDISSQKQDNNIPNPNNLQCILKEINNRKMQADLVFDNKIHKKHLDNDIRGYKYIWNIYGKEMNGFIQIEEEIEQHTGSTIVFNKQNNNLPIMVKVRTDYYEYVGAYVEIECKLSS